MEPNEAWVIAMRKFRETFDIENNEEVKALAVLEVVKPAWPEKERKKSVSLIFVRLRPYLKDARNFRYPEQYPVQFKDLPSHELIDLFNQGFIDPFSTVNESPEFICYYKWVEEYPAFTVHGYLDCDGKIMLEGVTFVGEVTVELASAFAKKWRKADDFEIRTDMLRCWWD